MAGSVLRRSGPGKRLSARVRMLDRSVETPCGEGGEAAYHGTRDFTDRMAWPGPRPTMQTEKRNANPKYRNPAREHPGHRTNQCVGAGVPDYRSARGPLRRGDPRPHRHRKLQVRSPPIPLLFPLAPPHSPILQRVPSHGYILKFPKIAIAPTGFPRGCACVTQPQTVQ